MAKLTFLGHAAFRIEGGGLDGLIDPFLTGNSMTPFSPEDFNDVNYIFVTHGHGDHLGDTPEIAKRTGAMVVTTVEMCNVLEGIKCHPLQIGGAFTFPFGRVKMTPAWHGSGVQSSADREMIYGGVAGGFLIEIDGRKIYHAGDTGLTVEMGLLAEDGVDVALLPIGGNYTMDVDDAVRAVRMIKPGVAVPMHYDTFPLIKASPGVFAAKASEFAKIKVLKPGESLEV